MPALSEHHSSKFVKTLYIGDSSTGKTGSLVSLLADGYKFRILDMDNGLDALRHYAQIECPDKLANVEYETRRDKYKSTNAGPVCLQPKAFVEANGIMTKWSEEFADGDENTIFVLDSLTAYGRSAFNWAKGMNQTAKDPRQWYFMAQQAVESVISLLTGEEFRVNVIVISHINWKEMQDGTTKGYANAIGSALGPILPKYFNTLILAESSVVGKGTRRKIKTVPTATIDLKVPSPKVDAEYPLETGMSAIFKKLKGQEA